MFYQIHGGITLHLPNHYYQVLDYWINKMNFENMIAISPKNIRFFGAYFTLFELKDLLSFLNQFATLADVDLLAIRRSNNRIVFQLHDGLIHEFPYKYHSDKCRIKPFSHLVQTIQEKNFSIHIDYTLFSTEEQDAFEATILAIKKQTKEDLAAEFATLATFVEKKGFIEILTELEKIRWHDTKSKNVSVFPFAISDEPQPIELVSPILSAYTYSEQEERRFLWRHFSFPLHPLFLSDSDKKSVTLPTGETTTPCSQCTFRLRHLTGKCEPCNPQLVPGKSKI